MDLESFDHRLHEVEQHYIEKKFNSDKVSKMIERYRELVVSIHIDDEKISRLCQVLTDYGCLTYESCEGHAKKMPTIWFYPPENPDALMRISHILRRASYAKNFPWHIVVEGNPNAGQQLSYVLQPSLESGQIVLPDDYQKLMQDIDIIAISILDYFADSEEE